jgi:hypothetical protein
MVQASGFSHDLASLLHKEQLLQEQLRCTGGHVHAMMVPAGDVLKGCLVLTQPRATIETLS